MRSQCVDVLLGRHVIAIDSPMAPVLKFADGATEGPFDLVIVADGARSALRSALFRPTRAKEYPWGALWAVVPDPQNDFADELFQVVRGASRMAGFLPTGTGTDGTPLVSLFWSVPTDRGRQLLQGPLATIKSDILALAPRAAPILDQLHATSDFTLASYMDVRMHPWHLGRIVCIGDAAHATSPQLGQGVNLGLVDARELTRCVELFPDIGVALARLASRRKAQVGYYQFASRLLTPFFQSDRDRLAVLRDLLLPAASRIGPIGMQMLRTMGGVKRGLLRRSLPIPMLPRQLPVSVER